MKPTLIYRWHHTGQPNYIIVAHDGSYWHRFKTKPLGHWTSLRRRATRMSLKLANSYVRDWKAYGIKKHRLSEQELWDDECVSSHKEMLTILKKNGM